MHILWWFHRRSQVKIFDVHHEAFCIWRGQDAVDEDFEENHVCCWHLAVVRIVDLVTAHCESCAIYFLFVRFKVTAEAAICRIFHSVGWDFFFLYESDCVGGFHPPVFESIG